MNKIISLFAILGTFVFGVVAPQSVEAFRLNIQPSISFHQSHTHHQPVYRQRVVYQQPPLVHHYYTPYETVTYVEEYPAYVETYSYPVYRRSNTVDYGITFQIR